ncbi:putative disease resistance protein rga3 [Phtheirospermum japonicum]|uniref:Putative disease resistance protein rga3 n=1 Tax=Phtheirospermum japonicum TaxID=374723 RepID=A0A830BWE9_9LAMI|nr:putative disease resistance protein rga3 [Phtheirospermum japonicum]
MGRRIKGINEKLTSINQQASEFGLQTRIVSAQAPVSGSDASGSTETDSFTVDPIFLGRENDVSRIVEKLIPTTQSQAEQVLSVLPIVGMGGLGKTTLAKKVFGDEQMISHFGDNRIWVYVSRNFDVRNILKNILTSLTEEKFELETREAILKKLQEHLRTKRYMLVLDDVWNVDKEMWDDFDCWSIIKAKAFNRSRDISLELETMGRNIAERCRGDQDPISKILKLSFDNLPSPSLKKCFAYCSVFPKGYEIEKEQLIELWMAEGFLQTDKMETTGSNVFNILLQNSLLQVAMSDDYGNVTHCNMHDLACSVVCENGMLQSRYIGCKHGGVGLLSIPKGQERYVRTLFFNGKVSDITFSDFKSLRTLTLVSEEDIDNLPTSFRELKHLRYLDISETRIKYLPDWIGELYHLQTLRAKNKSLSLPPGIGKLTSLQVLPYFHVGGQKGCGISELGSLKDLKGKIEIHNLEKVCDKNEATRADLLGKPGIYALKLVWSLLREGDEANDESVLQGLQPHPNLKSLKIFRFKGKSLPLWDGLNNLIKIKLQECSECEELPMLGHLPHLKCIYLGGLTNVKSIRSSFYGNIDNCKRDTIVVVFRALERLVLSDMPNLKEWAEVDFLQSSEAFPRLEYLRFYECKQLIWPPSHFPCLQELEIDGMESGLPLENICGMKLTSLTCLKINNIEGLECLPDGIFSNNHNLTKLCIINCPKMTRLVPCLGGGGAPSLLRELMIVNCSSLRELPEDLHILNSLERLQITVCPNLKSIPYPVSNRGGGGHESVHGFTSLRWLQIEICEGLTNFPVEMVESCAPSLEELTLYKLSNITNLGMVIRCLHKMTRLRELTIEDVPKLSSKDVIGSLNSWRFLKMGPSSSWNNNVSFNEAVDAMLLQSVSLRILTLTGMKHWDCLPDQIQHLTSLELLCLDDFGIEAMPEWFGNLSSLETLHLWHCEKLRHLPSKQAMQRLSKLTYLWIYRCPLLISKERKRSNNNDELPQIVDSEWPKISHIPELVVEDRRISSDGH